MKKFESVYEVGPHYSISEVVEARTEASALKKADKIVNAEHRYPMFVHIRELIPVDRLEYEQELKVRDNKIFDLESQLSDIRSIVGEYK